MTSISAISAIWSSLQPASQILRFYDTRLSLPGVRPEENCRNDIFTLVFCCLDYGSSILLLERYRLWN